MTYPWIDPTLGYPNPTLIPGVVELKQAPFVAIRNGAAHKAVPWMKAIHTHLLEHVDDTDWELYRITHRGTVDGQNYVWGQFVEGMGMVHVMVREEDVRHLTETERKTLSGHRMAMVGSHSGNVSYTFNLPEL